LLRDSAFGAAVKDGSLKGRLSSGSPSTVIVTDTPENVRAFLQKQKSESLWEPLTTFRKE
jgi:PII-like signaling protein